jgi:hypothetical protein
MLLTFTGCDSDEPEDTGGESELITRVEVTLTPPSGAPISIVASDPDGDGVNITVAPDTLVLEAGTTYDGAITLTDEINDEDITAEVEEESDVHQFFYSAAGDAAGRITITYAADDLDENGYPIGLAFVVSVTEGEAADGVLNVVLSHYDATPKNGTDRSDETDIDVDFPIAITATAVQ